MLWFDNVVVSPREIGDGYARLRQEYKSFILWIKESIGQQSPLCIKHIDFTPSHYLFSQKTPLALKHMQYTNKNKMDQWLDDSIKVAKIKSLWTIDFVLKKGGITYICTYTKVKLQICLWVLIDDWLLIAEFMNKWANNQFIQSIHNRSWIICAWTQLIMNFDWWLKLWLLMVGWSWNNEKERIDFTKSTNKLPFLFKPESLLKKKEKRTGTTWRS